MKWWDHTKPFPETMETACPEEYEMRKRFWEEGPERFAERLRDARIITIQHRASGMDIKVCRDDWLYEKFPELTKMADDAESSFLALQNSGQLPPPPTQFQVD